ncbi:MAG: hypothetical protein RLZ27_389 [Pseudomonadota bacterium]
MRNILLITSHYPPSNLTATHRVRMFAKHLPMFGWNPFVLTVDEKFYEEKPDLDLTNLIPQGQRLERVDAYKLTKPRLIGDVGLRAFFQLKKRAIEIISKEKIDFVYIFIPSFYLSLLGPLLHKRFGIKYGIDYIDPWVHFFPGSEKKLSRHWWSTFFSKILEPIAIKNVSLITGVSELYYLPVFERNPTLKGKVETSAIPYGWDKDDLKVAPAIDKKLIFRKNDKIKLVYPGAYLPQSKTFLESFFNIIASNRELFRKVEFYFIGTGKVVDSKFTAPVKEIAEKYKVYDDVIFEFPHRLGYLNTLHHIAKADGLFILGSSEEHYTPSKLFNAFITRRPIFAILHQNSSGKEIIESSGWGIVTPFNDQTPKSKFEENILGDIMRWLSINQDDNWKFNDKVANAYSITPLTSKLNDLISAVI